MSKKSTNSTLKFLIYTMVFTIIVFIFVLFVVIPGIKEYKRLQGEHTAEKRAKQALQQEYGTLQKHLEVVKTNNQEVIDIFFQEFNSTSFIANAKKYFDDAKITQVASDSNSSALQVYQFSADAQAQNPTRFYEFVKTLHAYDGIIKINFPITITTENKLLKINFHMSVYSMQHK
ncbi:MAG: hypothetical protein K0U47_01580 [Epsilonproteobacteria bacterium]|nr:hypothetical protein [Campylobacterota bacterium]